MKSLITNLNILFVIVFLSASCGDPCDGRVCYNGGVCLSGECACPQGFSGERCQIRDCILMDCQNGGFCETGQCHCVPGFGGANCEIRLASLFVGEYSAKRSCHPATIAGSNDYTVRIDSDPSSNISLNLSGFEVDCTGIIESTDYFTIPYQAFGQKSISGYGQLKEDKTIYIHFSYVLGDATWTCSLDLARV